MDEARRFLRYVIPGLVFAIESLLFLWILLPGWAASHLGSLATKELGVGLVAAATLVLGGLGFIFSIVHHASHWFRWVNFRPVIDHRQFVAFHESNFRTANAVGQISRLDAWIMVSVMWHERIQTSKRIASADNRMGDLYDLMHSLGTLRVACLGAFVFALTIFGYQCGNFNCHVENTWPFLSFLAIAVTCFIIHYFNYRVTGRIAQRFVEQVLSDELTENWP